MADGDQSDGKSINEVLAENLAYFMGQKGFTQTELATKAGMGQTTVSLYLTPSRRAPGKSGKEPSAKLAEVQRLADALGAQLWELLRPLTPAQRDFYRTMEHLIAERAADAATEGVSFSRRAARNRPPLEIRGGKKPLNVKPPGAPAVETGPEPAPAPSGKARSRT